MFTCVRWRECSRREREREFEGWDYGRFFHCCCSAYVHALNFLHLTVITLVLGTSCHHEIQNSHGNISNSLSFTDWKSIVNNPVRFMICLAERVQMQAELAPDLEKEGEREGRGFWEEGKCWGWRKLRYTIQPGEQRGYPAVKTPKAKACQSNMIALLYLLPATTHPFLGDARHVSILFAFPILGMQLWDWLKE